VSRRGQKLEAADAVRLVRARDTVMTGLAGGQTPGLLEALGTRTDLEQVSLYGALFMRPYALLEHPAIRVQSGFFGPAERVVRAQGATIEYMPVDFHGTERLLLRSKPRVIFAATTPPDREGWLNFGIHAGATDRVLRAALTDPERLVVCEANPHMPWIEGMESFGRNRVHVSQIDAWVEHPVELLSLPAIPATPEETAIARHVEGLIEDGATLQFGIGGVPDEVATLLANGTRRGFGIHTEMFSDGAMRLHLADKVANRKGLYDGVSVATFAFGSAELYRWLDHHPLVRMLPVSATNEPAQLRQLTRFVSINGALIVDSRGQVAADYVAGRQYSGIGGHESFVMGASEAPGGRSIVCLKSTATVNGQRISTIVPRLPEAATVTTPRHHVQWIVTEHGAVDLSPLGDRSRARALIEIAHPDFRLDLQRTLEEESRHG